MYAMQGSVGSPAASSIIELGSGSDAIVNSSKGVAGPSKQKSRKGSQAASLGGSGGSADRSHKSLKRKAGKEVASVSVLIDICVAEATSSALSLS